MGHTAPQVGMSLSGGTVLVVDDDSDLRSLYRCWLAESFEVRTAADGVEAIERLDETVDVVVLDREMPRKDGVAVAREIDRREFDPGVVMISGVEPGVELLDLSVDDYLQKPATRELVLERVCRARAITEEPRARRHLLSLDTRRQVVEASASTRTLTDPVYQQAVDTLERHSDTLAEARRSVQGDGEQPGAASSTPFRTSS